MATQPLGEALGYTEIHLRVPIDRSRAPGVPPPTRQQVSVLVADAPDRRALAESRARHPSADRHDESPDEPTCPACGSTSMTAAGSPGAVRRLVTLASQLLRGSTDEERRHLLGCPTTPGWSPVERVALLRDELQVTANRVARFGVDDHPIVDPVLITAPTAASAALAMEQLLFQLDLSAGRLIALLDPLSPRDWTRTCRVGDRLVTLGELVAGVVHRATHDLVDLLPAAPVLAPDGMAALTDARPPPDRREAHSPNCSPMREVNPSAAAS